MADLIDRQALLNDIQAAADNGGMGAVVAGTLKRYVKRAPAVDAVEVVRCKDCEYYNVSCCSPGCGWCEHFERGEFDSHYCYGADRRADNAEK